MLMGEEVTISMPWGTLAGKAWGVKGGNPTLCLHGYNDNAAVYDGLIPLLFYDTGFFLAIDLPGNGKSDHYPNTSQVSDIDYLADIKRICLHYSWTHLNILVHSMACRTALYFAAVFPKLVKKLIILDLTHGGILYESTHICDVVSHEVNSLIRYGKGELQKSLAYNEEEVFKKFKEGRIADLNNENITPIFLRSTKKVDNKWFLTRDKRNIKLMTPLITKQFHTALISCVSCPTLLLMSSGGNVVFEKLKPTKETFDILKENLKYKLTTIETNYSHDMHIEAPEMIAPIIRSFILIQNKL